jgi:hypothetical protein
MHPIEVLNNCITALKDASGTYFLYRVCCLLAISLPTLLHIIQQVIRMSDRLFSRISFVYL